MIRHFCDKCGKEILHGKAINIKVDDCSRRMLTPDLELCKSCGDKIIKLIYCKEELKADSEQRDTGNEEIKRQPEEQVEGQLSFEDILKEKSESKEASEDGEGQTENGETAGNKGEQGIGQPKNPTPSRKKKEDDVVNSATVEEIAKAKEKFKSSKKIDVGKLIALRRAGWSNRNIADEFGVSTQYIGYIVHVLKKAVEEKRMMQNTKEDNADNKEAESESGDTTGNME